MPVPLGGVIEPVTVTQFSQPPVPAIATDPARGPVIEPARNSSVPPALADETRAVTPVTPVRLYGVNDSQSPFSMAPTQVPPALGPGVTGDVAAGVAEVLGLPVRRLQDDLGVAPTAAAVVGVGRVDDAEDVVAPAVLAVGRGLQDTGAAGRAGYRVTVLVVPEDEVDLHLRAVDRAVLGAVTVTR